MEKEILLRLLGVVYNWMDYAFFLFFALWGLGIIKNIRYKYKKEKYINSGKLPLWKWSFKKWCDENLMDSFLTITISFVLLRFIGFWLKQLPVPEHVDVMLYGFLLGLFIQKVLHGIFQKVTIKNTIKKITN